MSSCTLHVSVGVFTRTPFSPYPAWWTQLFGGWMEHLWLWCLAEFLRFKGRKNIYLYSSYLTIEWALIVNCYRVRLLLRYRQLLTGTDLSCRFCWIGQGSFISSVRLQIRLVFFPKNISNLNCSIKVQLGDFIEQEGDLPPHCVHLLVYRCWSVIVGLPFLIAVTFFFGSSFRERRIEQMNNVLRTRWLFALHCWSASIDRSLVFSFEQERDETQISTAQWDFCCHCGMVRIIHTRLFLSFSFGKE
jgi:hypothetical protein